MSPNIDPPSTSLFPHELLSQLDLQMRMTRHVTASQSALQLNIDLLSNKGYHSNLNVRAPQRTCKINLKAKQLSVVRLAIFCSLSHHRTLRFFALHNLITACSSARTSSAWCRCLLRNYASTLDLQRF